MFSVLWKLDWFFTTACRRLKTLIRFLLWTMAEIVERGNHDQLMQKQGKYYQMYQLQQGEKATMQGRAGPESLLCMKKMGRWFIIL